MEKVDIEKELFYASEGVIRPQLSKQFNDIAMFTGTDIFAMKPKVESASLTLALEINDTTQAERIRLQIYGDSESVEHAKTRVLIVIDDLVRRVLLPFGSCVS